MTPEPKKTITAAPTRSLVRNRHIPLPRPQPELRLSPFGHDQDGRDGQCGIYADESGGGSKTRIIVPHTVERWSARAVPDHDRDHYPEEREREGHRVEGSALGDARKIRFPARCQPITAPAHHPMPPPSAAATSKSGSISGGGPCNSAGMKLPTMRPITPRVIAGPIVRRPELSRTHRESRLFAWAIPMPTAMPVRMPPPIPSSKVVGSSTQPKMESAATVARPISPPRIPRRRQGHDGTRARSRQAEPLSEPRRSNCGSERSRRQPCREVEHPGLESGKTADMENPWSHLRLRTDFAALRERERRRDLRRGSS